MRVKIRAVALLTVRFSGASAGTLAITVVTFMLSMVKSLSALGSLHDSSVTRRYIFYMYMIYPRIDDMINIAIIHYVYHIRKL